MKLKEELEQLYEGWLLEEYNDEIHNKDDFVEKLGHGLHWEEFVEKVQEALE